MRNDRRREARAAQEAAAWHARLGAKSVTTDAIADFFEWRNDPLNDAAYRKVERLWAQAKGLQGRPAIEAAIDGALSRQARRGRRRVWIGAAGLVAATLVGALCLGFWLDGRDRFSTAVGGERVLQLGDGSVVRLDTDSRVRVRFDGRRRLVELDQGRALFEVAHDAARPFVVRADGTEVRAVGTVFDVSRLGAGVTVSMVEGVVEVSDDRGGEGPQRVAAGQQIQLKASQRRIVPINPAVETSWTQRRLVFRAIPLSEAVAQVNRYLKAPIVLADDVPRTAPVSGVFHTGDREAFTAAASVLLGLEAVRLPDGEVRLQADKNLQTGIAVKSR